MKTGLYLCYVGIAFVMFVEVSSQDRVSQTEPVDKQGRLYLESAQSQNAAAAAEKQSSSYLNVDGGYGGYGGYPTQNYLGLAQQAPPQYSGPGGWSGADGSLQLGQQSSESATAHASSNQFSSLIADGPYGGQAVNQYPQYLPSGLASLQDQSAQSGATASASAQSSGSQFQGLNGNSYYPISSLLRQNQAEASGSAQAGPSNLVDYQAPSQRQFVGYPPEYYAQPRNNYLDRVSGGSSAAASAGASSGSLGASSLGGSGVFSGGSGLSEAGASAAASSQSFQQKTRDNPLVPRLKCGYVRQCQTVLE